MVKVGQKVCFDPMANIVGTMSESYPFGQVTGTVVMVNYKHKWFSVVYGKPQMRTSFNFADIGEAVTVCG